MVMRPPNVGYLDDVTSDEWHEVSGISIQMRAMDVERSGAGLGLLVFLALQLLMPISSRRQLLDLPDDLVGLGRRPLACDDDLPDAVGWIGELHAEFQRELSRNG
jgi:hypothetical protein